VFVDMPLDQLRGYLPTVAEPADFDSFWSEQLEAARNVDAGPTFELVETPIRHADVLDVTFPGYGGDSVKGWLLVPHELAPDLALVVEYVGYNGGRGHPLDWLPYSSAGHPHFVMDSRGQGGGWRSADTPDPGDPGTPSTPGFLTRGIADPATHYYTRLFVDAARAVDAAREHPVSRDRPLVTAGISQGGALAVAAGHLVEGRAGERVGERVAERGGEKAGQRAGGVAATMPDVPFLAHVRRAVEITDSKPFGELIEFCRVNSDRIDQVFATLSYVDVVNHAKRVTAPALFSVGLLDDITPASTVFAAYNHYGGPKDIAVYPFNAHEGGGTRHLLAKLELLARLRMGADPPINRP